MQPDHWLAEYTSDLIDLLNVLGRLAALEPAQESLLERILAAQMINVASVQKALARAAATDESALAGEKID